MACKQKLFPFSPLTLISSYSLVFFSCISDRSVDSPPSEMYVCMPRWLTAAFRARVLCEMLSESSFDWYVFLADLSSFLVYLLLFTSPCAAYATQAPVSA